MSSLSISNSACSKPNTASQNINRLKDIELKRKELKSIFQKGFCSFYITMDNEISRDTSECDSDSSETSQEAVAEPDPGQVQFEFRKIGNKLT